MPADPPGRTRFVRAPLPDAAARLAAVLREERAEAFITDDEGGGYGHRDPRWAHRVGAEAARLARCLRLPRPVFRWLFGHEWFIGPGCRGVASAGTRWTMNGSRLDATVVRFGAVVMLGTFMAVLDVSVVNVLGDGGAFSRVFAISAGPRGPDVRQPT